MPQFLHKIVSFFKSKNVAGYAGVAARTHGKNDIYTPKQIVFESDFSDFVCSNLRKTICWTEAIISKIEDVSNINYSTVLRSINPLYQARPFYIFDDSPNKFASTPSIGFDYNVILSKVLEQRMEPSVLYKNINTLGKILIFEIDLTTHDGAPCVESSGFVDESDIPPIDTWFFVNKKYLFCWIPQMFTTKMQDAIDVEIFGSYTWLEDVNQALNSSVISKVEMGISNLK